MQTDIVEENNKASHKNTVLEVKNICKTYQAKNGEIEALKNINFDKYGSMFKEYVKSLSNKDNFKYRLIVEFKNNEEYSYANVGFNYE